MAFVYKNPLHEPADHSFDMDEKGRVASPHTSDFLAVASRDVESLNIDEVESEHAVHHARLRTCCKWIRWFLLASLAASAAIGLALYLGPILLEKVIVPLMGWEVAHLSKPVMALVAIACLAFLPLFFLPTGPTMWVVGIIFGYLWGFPLLYFGVFLGQTFSYFIGHWLLHDRIQVWLSGDPRNAALLKLADDGGWMHQFRVVVLLRMSPFPYALFNYAVTATEIKYGPYIAASMVVQIPECFLAIYCGRLIKTLADLHHQQQRRLTPLEMASEGMGLLIAVSITALGMFYGNRALKELEARGAGGGVLQVGGPRSGPLGYRVSGRKEGMGWVGMGVPEGLSWGPGRVERGQNERVTDTLRGGGGGQGGGTEGEEDRQLESEEVLGIEGGLGGDGDKGVECELELFSVESREEGDGVGEREEEGHRNGDVPIKCSEFGVGPTTVVGEGMRGLLGMGKQTGWRQREGMPLLKEDETERGTSEE